MKSNKNQIASLSGKSSLQELREVRDALAEDAAEHPSHVPARERLHRLWDDKRPFSIRACTAALCAFAFVFTFIIFGPCELYIQSIQFLTFPFTDLLLHMSLIGLGIFAVLFALLCTLQGKIYNYALSSLFAVTFAGYIQRNFLNIDHGSLDGHAVEWQTFAADAVWNFLFWCALAIAVFALMYFSRQIWTYSVRIICIILIGAQTVALTAMLMETSFPVREKNAIVSDADLYNVTTGNNVVFFLLDTFDNAYADELLSRHPEWEEKLGGFTYYHNFTGSYLRTMPAVTYLLTGVKCDYSIPYHEYFKKAWTTSSFLSDIREAGYKLRIYSDRAYVFGTDANLSTVADNYVEIGRRTHYGMMFNYMMSLSAYVYAPEAFKPYFLLNTSDLTAISTTERTDLNIYKVNDFVFWNGLRNRGLTVEEGKGMFTFYHLNGAHVPYTMTEEGEEKEAAGGLEALYTQTTGVMNMIFEYMEMLRETGQFDNTTIIISTDHARQGTLQALDDVRCPILFIKPAGADSSVKMTTSSKQVCQDNLRTSILSYLGLDTTEYGRTIESIGEDEEMVRYFWMQACNEDKKQRDYETVTYEIRGDANDFENWTEVARVRNRYPFYDAK